MDATQAEPDDAGRGIFGVGDERQITREQFADLKSERCPLHDHPYVGYSTFRVARVSSMPGSREPTAIGHLYVVCCAPCVEAAQKCRKQNLIWKRDNAPQHPVWGAKQLYPLLINGQQAKVNNVFTAFDEKGGQMVATGMLESRDARTRADGILALRYQKTDDNIRLMKQSLVDMATQEMVPGWSGSKHIVQSCAIDVLSGWKCYGVDERAIVAKVRSETRGYSVY